MYETPFDYTYTTTGVEEGLVVGIFAMLAGLWLFILAVVVILVVSLWKIFVKAGKPGWAALIPVYNMIVLVEIIEKPIWWVVLLLIPYVNLVGTLLVSIELAKKFGKSTAFGVVALWLFSFVGYPTLAFGSAKYGASAPAKKEKAAE